MNVTILHTEHCPNLGPLLNELQEALAGRGGVTVVTTVVRSEDEATRLGFHGSPTILIDGNDPCPFAAESVGLSCRQYATGDGLRGFPSRAQLEIALGGVSSR
jgi:hypothetical protein